MMKKIFKAGMLVALVTLAIPALAKEVKLTCEFKDKQGEVEHRTFTFDPEEEKVNNAYMKNNERCEKEQKNQTFYCSLVYVQENEITEIIYLKNEKGSDYSKVTILNRVNGTIKTEHAGTIGGKSTFDMDRKGICVPFKQAF